MSIGFFSVQIMLGFTLARTHMLCCTLAKVVPSLAHLDQGAKPDPKGHPRETRNCPATNDIVDYLDRAEASNTDQA
jgi:hypothetical protein